LARFEDKVTRLEVHLGDENSDKSESTTNDVDRSQTSKYATRCSYQSRRYYRESLHGALDKKSVGHGFRKQKA
jgi:hypothetical protein